MKTFFWSALKFSEESRKFAVVRTFFWSEQEKIGQPFGTRKSFSIDTIKKWHAALKRWPTPALNQLFFNKVSLWNKPRARNEPDRTQNQINFSLHSRYYPKACNEWRGPYLGKMSQRSRWRPCADLTYTGIEPQTS